MGIGWKEIAAVAANPTMVLGTIGAGADSYLGYKGAQEEAEAVREANRQNYELALKEQALQKEFAQMGIRWRVEDAEKAGLHPLAALGAAGASYSPSGFQVMTEPKGNKYRAVGESVRSMGQEISRAVQARMTAPERQMQVLHLERAQLENDLLRAQIGSIQNNQLPPPTPTFTEGNTFHSADGSQRFGPTHPSRPAQEGGYKPDVAYSRGDVAAHPYIPQQLAESYESDPVGSIFWRIRNQLMPHFNPWAGRPPVSDLPEGYDMWRWSISQQGWVPQKVWTWQKEKVRRKALERENRYKGAQ